ncbi:MAG: hypothetical protein AAFY15_16995, partial [Cyanobacteria bacterium J06648_11]
MQRLLLGSLALGSLALGSLVMAYGSSDRSAFASEMEFRPRADLISQAPNEEAIAIALVSPSDRSVPMGAAELVLEVTDTATNEPVEIDDLEV